MIFLNGKIPLSAQEDTKPQSIEGLEAVVREYHHMLTTYSLYNLPHLNTTDDFYSDTGVGR